MASGQCAQGKQMRRLILALLGIVSLATCSTQNFRLKPEHKGVEPKLQAIVDKYMDLSKQNDIRFYNKVSIGFKKLDSPAVGVCWTGGWFREIDIDPDYWKEITNLSKQTLLFHELTHCYCGRPHDYGKSKRYPESEEARLKQAIVWIVEGGERPGFWEDGCPVSIMYPVVIDDFCMRAHYGEYMTEMFDRCKPW